MRRISAALAIVIAIFGFSQLMTGRGDFFAVTVVLYSAALIVSAVVALRGGALIYLATSWSLYLGLNLAAYADVVSFSGKKADPISIFVTVVLTALPITATVGLGLTLLAYRREGRT